MERIREAIELCLEIEEPVVNEFIGVQLDADCLFKSCVTVM